MVEPGSAAPVAELSLPEAHVARCRVGLGQSYARVGKFALIKHQRYAHAHQFKRAGNAPPEHRFRVYTAGQKRRVTPQIRREFRRRSAIEPVIGHLKDDHRMRRNYLAHASGDAINAVLAAAGYNFRRLIRWLSLLLLRIVLALTALAGLLQPKPA